MRIKNLLKLTKGYLWVYVILASLVVFLRWSYSYVPLFTQYLIRTLTLYVEPNAIASDVNLPSFLLNFFESGGADIINVVLYIALALVAWQLTRFIIMFFESYFKGRTQENLTLKLRTRLYDHIQNLPYKFHNNADTGDLIQRVTSDVETTTRFVIVRTLDFISLIAGLTTGAIQMYFISPLLMMIAVIAMPITAVASIIYFLKIDKLFIKVEQKESEMMTTIQENVAASKVVKAFANERFEIEKMDKKNREYSDINVKANKIVAYYWGGMDFLMMLQFSAVIIVGILYARAGVLDTASVVAALMLVGVLIWPIRGLGRLINDFGKALVASDRIFYLLNQPTEYLNDGTLTPEIKGAIEFKNVNFKFDDTPNYLLKDISFKIKPGDTIALVGKTGAGKSTIVNLLLRYFDYEGSILIDDVELKDIKKHYIRSKIGAVLQDPFLYSKTVYENIAITNKNADHHSIEAAAINAAIAKDINTFKQGYQTTVGEKGATLSGGQKQRVAIARILVDPKPILIFDDALSALDNKTDLMIRQSLKQRAHNNTTIIVTHRITTAKEADLIVVVNNNQIEDIGTHEALSTKPGLYQNLWNIQGKLEEEFMELLKAGVKNES